MGWRSSSAERPIGAPIWAIIGAFFLLAGGVLLIGGEGLGLRVFGLFVLAQGAKALWVGVELQFGGRPAGRRRLVGLLLLTAGILVTLAVARLVGTWR